MGLTNGSHPLAVSNAKRSPFDSRFSRQRQAILVVLRIVSGFAIMLKSRGFWSINMDNKHVQMTNICTFTTRTRILTNQVRRESGMLRDLVSREGYLCEFENNP